MGRKEYIHLKKVQKWLLAKLVFQSPELECSLGSKIFNAVASSSEKSPAVKQAQ